MQRSLLEILLWVRSMGDVVCIIVSLAVAWKDVKGVVVGGRLGDTETSPAPEAVPQES
jgi:hypothetical protein